jgi:hypothetical protein
VFSSALVLGKACEDERIDWKTRRSSRTLGRSGIGHSLAGVDDSACYRPYQWHMQSHGRPHPSQGQATTASRDDTWQRTVHDIGGHNHCMEVGRLGQPVDFGWIRHIRHCEWQPHFHVSVQCVLDYGTVVRVLLVENSEKLVAPQAVILRSSIGGKGICHLAADSRKQPLYGIKQAIAKMEPF